MQRLENAVVAIKNVINALEDIKTNEQLAPAARKLVAENAITQARLAYGMIEDYTENVEEESEDLDEDE